LLRNAQKCAKKPRAKKKEKKNTFHFPPVFFYSPCCETPQNAINPIKKNQEIKTKQKQSRKGSK
jgi:hypothetical protein